METWLPVMAMRIEQQLGQAIQDKESLHKAKTRLAKELGAPRLPQDPEFLPLLGESTRNAWGDLFKKKPMRSQSGVAIIAVMSSPASCPHGKCIYCPGGPEVDAPQSYTGFEPSTMRAKRHGYDPYRVVRSRLWQLQHNGHAIDKLEIVVQGGTFPARDEAYQDHFIAGIYAACNDGPEEHPEPFPSWENLDPAARSERLEALQQANEDAGCRVIGLTIETKPDWCLEPHIDAMLRHGATRIELGIQTLSDEVTALTNRGHTVQEAADAMRIARDAGFKVCVHMMPGLPRPTQTKGHYAVDKAADIEDIRELFEGDAWKPDMLKIYPTLIVEEGETTLKKWWREGRFEPLDTDGAVDVVAEALRHVPEHCRIQRIDRDIPTTHVVAGVQNSNLRQLAEAEALQRGVRLRDIRAREVGTRLRDGVPVDTNRIRLVRRDHDASDGLEAFLSLEDPEADAVIGFLRLRRVGSNPHRPEFQHPNGAAVVRELKVYGTAQALGQHDDPETGAWQHQGHGARLLAEAERIAADWGVGRLLVIAGRGVKAYYRRHGYDDLGPYVAKSLS
ncbi:MAG: tRNA uridine(34) 5-carboxymethylaminomethyl modification radical SAM/GNAT enzyme Elp3 [Thermoplasmatota archaeon]